MLTLWGKGRCGGSPNAKAGMKYQAGGEREGKEEREAWFVNYDHLCWKHFIYIPRLIKHDV
jgi:hypothetical protein